MKAYITIFTLLIAVFTTHDLNAQQGFRLEVNGGAAFPLEQVGGGELETGIPLEGLLSYYLTDQFGIYAGWGWTQFSTESAFGGMRLDFEETGYRLGVEFANHIGESSFGYYVRLGGLFNHIEVEDTDGDIIGDSEHGLGWQAGLGATIDLGSNIELRPGVRYQSLTRDVEYDVVLVPAEVELKYIGATLGVHVKF
jgi:opacity protein-like surface antigen